MFTPTRPTELLKRACAAALAKSSAPVFLGTLAIDDIDRQMSALMAEGRRLFNEEPKDDWGLKAGRHRGDEATQQKTFADGAR